MTVSCLLIVATFAGCTTGNDGEEVIGTEGQLGKASFGWWSTESKCTERCQATEPIAAGSFGALFVVNRNELPNFDVASDNPELIEFALGQSRDLIYCRANRPGIANLVLTDSETGAVIDKLAIRVEDVARIKVTGEPADGSLTLMVGGRARIFFALESATGEGLEGSEALDYEIDGSVRAPRPRPVQDFLNDLLVGLITQTVAVLFTGETIDVPETPAPDSVLIEAAAIGSGSVTALAANGTSLEVPVEVVDASAVEQVDLEVDDTLQVGFRLRVGATAFGADGEMIASPDCQWEIDPADGPITISARGRSLVELVADSPATATLICTVGSAMGSAEIEAVER